MLFAILYNELKLYYKIVEKYSTPEILEEISKDNYFCESSIEDVEMKYYNNNNNHNIIYNNKTSKIKKNNQPKKVKYDNH